MRRLPGPAVDRLGDGDNSRGSRQSCFGTGSEHKFNLRRGLCGVLDRKWMSGCVSSECWHVQWGSNFQSHRGKSQGPVAR
jgi:hypothetical protein